MQSLLTLKKNMLSLCVSTDAPCMLLTLYANFSAPSWVRTAVLQNQSGLLGAPSNMDNNGTGFGTGVTNNLNSGRSVLQTR